VRTKQETSQSKTIGERRKERQQRREKVEAVHTEVKSQPKGLDASDPVMAMAIRFEELAYENRVSLGGRGAPYLAAMFRESVERSGMLTRKYRDGDSKPVPLPLVGRTVVRLFWDKAPWDREGDVARQFADPIMFEDCLAAVVERWANRRGHKDLVARRGY
jgi:hypothetical protein